MTDSNSGANQPSQSGPDDNLPPVSPPSAGFLMQLFVVPMVIVVIIVMVCLMFNWLAHLGSKPEDLVDDLTKLNPGSWQKALTIANMLCDPNQAELRQNDVMADRLAEILQAQVERGEMGDEQIQLRVYLCLALGVFEVNNGLPALVEAASTQRQPQEIQVRMKAIEALARRADGMPNGQETLRADQGVMNALLEASKQFEGGGDEKALNSQLRSRAAYTYGVIGGEESLNQLHRMTADPDMTVRFNAATGLARNGDARSTPVLLDMLDVQQVTQDDGEPLDMATSIMVLRNALRAVKQLSESNTSDNLDELKVAVQKVADSDSGGAVAVDAKLALQSLNDRSS